MSDSSSTGTENTGEPKKKVSSTRNAIGLVVLLVVVVVGIFQYWAYFQFRAATNALDARTRVEDKDLMDIQEADTLLGKSPDGPGSDVKEGFRTFAVKTYTWQGPIRSYTLTAFYTKDENPHLHHFETAGGKYVPEPDYVLPKSATGGPVSRGKMKKAKAAAESSKPATTTAPAKTAEPAVEPAKPATSTAPAKTAEPAAPSLKPATATDPAPAKSAEPASASPKPATTGTPVPPTDPK